MKPSLVTKIARRNGALPDPISRRRFLKTTLAAGAALMLGGKLPAAGSVRPRVVIIGAGFGGLSCAYQLSRAGVDVLILEARNRIGGRVLSIDNFIEDRVVEAGAELIGSNHPTWMAYGERFGLEFHDVTPLQDDRSPILLDGKLYEGSELAALWEGLAETLNLLNADARKVDLQAPWNTPGARELDGTSLAQAAALWEVPDAFRKAALTVLANDNVAIPGHSSYLANLAAIAGGGYEQFWTESEVYRCVGGNQSLAFKLAEQIGEEHIRLNQAVEKITLGNQGARVRTAVGETHEADAVVLTVPPPAWTHFQVEPTIPDSYRPDTGPAIKYLSKVSEPFWLAAGLQPNSITDTPIGQTWEGTDAQRSSDKEPACLTVFSGGEAARQCLEIPANERRDTFKKLLEPIYPGYGESFQKGMFLGWPNEKWTLCGYSAPGLGQVTSVYPLLNEAFHGKLHFAGEYTSLLFSGFMEGALHSGAHVAAKLAQSLNA